MTHVLRWQMSEHWEKSIIVGCSKIPQIKRTLLSKLKPKPKEWIYCFFSLNKSNSCLFLGSSQSFNSSTSSISSMALVIRLSKYEISSISAILAMIQLNLTLPWLSIGCSGSQQYYYSHTMWRRSYIFVVDLWHYKNVHVSHTKYFWLICHWAHFKLWFVLSEEKFQKWTSWKTFTFAHVHTEDFHTMCFRQTELDKKHTFFFMLIPKSPLL